MSYYRTQLEDFLRTLDVKARMVLDIGGADLPAEGRTKSWWVEKSLIADITNNYDVFLDLNKPLEAQAEGSRSFYLLPDKYDLIFCLEVFEYIYNPLQAMQNISELLQVGGRAYITFPFLYPHHNPIEYDFLRYTEFGVRKLCELSGLSVSGLVKRRTITDAWFQYIRDDGMRAARAYDHDVTGFICEVTK